MKKAQHLLGFFHIQSAISNLPGGLGQIQHCTWLAPEPSAPSGRNERGGAWGIARSGRMPRLCEIPGRCFAKPNARERLLQSILSARLQIASCSTIRILRTTLCKPEYPGADIADAQWGDFCILFALFNTPGLRSSVYIIHYPYRWSLQLSVQRAIIFPEEKTRSPTELESRNTCWQTNAFIKSIDCKYARMESYAIMVYER